MKKFNGFFEFFCARFARKRSYFELKKPSNDNFNLFVLSFTYLMFKIVIDAIQQPHFSKIRDWSDSLMECSANFFPWLHPNG